MCSRAKKWSTQCQRTIKCRISAGRPFAGARRKPMWEKPPLEGRARVRWPRRRQPPFQVWNGKAAPRTWHAMRRALAVAASVMGASVGCMKNTTPRGRRVKLPSTTRDTLGWAATGGVVSELLRQEVARQARAVMRTILATHKALHGLRILGWASVRECPPTCCRAGHSGRTGRPSSARAGGTLQVGRDVLLARQQRPHRLVDPAAVRRGHGAADALASESCAFEHPFGCASADLDVGDDTLDAEVEGVLG